MYNNDIDSPTLLAYSEQRHSIPMEIWQREWCIDQIRIFRSDIAEKRLALLADHQLAKAVIHLWYSTISQ
jgi:hypothetical protein